MQLIGSTMIVDTTFTALKRAANVVFAVHAFIALHAISFYTIHGLGIMKYSLVDAAPT